MKKAILIITITCIFMLSFSYENISGSVGLRKTSDSDNTSESVQTQTKSSQTATKPLQTKTKSTQTVKKSTQTGTKSVQAKTKTTQSGTKSTTTKPKSVQAKAKPAQTGTKPTLSPVKSQPDSKSKDIGIVMIGSQAWSVTNLNVSTFRNGDTIPEAKSNKDWVAAGDAGKPAWCYYNNDPANGPRYGKLYNWYAVNDPRELAPAGWTLSSDEDWAQLAHDLGGQGAGMKMKNVKGWIEDNNGTNESGFTGLAGGYRVENGAFKNLGSIGTWWSSTESNSLTAFDHYLAQNSSLGKSNSPKQRGESVRCIRK